MFENLSLIVKNFKKFFFFRSFDLLKLSSSLLRYFSYQKFNMDDPVEIVDIGLADLSWAEFIKSRALYSFTSSSITERLEFLNHSLIPRIKAGG